MSSSLSLLSSSTKISRQLCEIARQMEPVARCRVVSALVRRKKILALGVNSYDSVKLARRFPKHELALSTHAEIAAIHNYLKVYGADRISECTLYVVRLLANGQLASAKPCRGCEEAIKAFNIKRVIHS